MRDEDEEPVATAEVPATRQWTVVAHRFADGGATLHVTTLFGPVVRVELSEAARIHLREAL